MKRFNSSVSFLDVIFNILLGVFALFLFTIILINEPTKKGDIPLKAEVLVTMEWQKGSDDDVDVFVLTPASRVPVSFKNRDIGVASLDRDDLGMRNDVIKMEDGSKVVVEDNWEHVAIRKTVPGEYVVNVYMYFKFDEAPTPVFVKIEKLNPYRLIFAGEIILSEQGQEETALRFHIDKSGNITKKSQIPFSLKPHLKGRTNGPGIR